MLGCCNCCERQGKAVVDSLNEHGWLFIKVASVCTRFFNYFGKICSVVGQCLAYGTSLMFLRFLLPCVVDPHTPLGALDVFITIWLTFNTCFNYSSAVWTKGSKADQDEWAEAVVGGQEGTNGPEYQDRIHLDPTSGRPIARVAGKTAKWCKKCEAPKPPRAHHCAICNRCVLKMDHHCPWIGGCVGHANHRYFTLFLCYVWITAMWIGTHCYLWRHHNAKFNTGFFDVEYRNWVRKYFTAVFTLCLALTIAISIFMVWNTYLVVTNQTTIELIENRFVANSRKSRGVSYKHPFDLGLLGNIEVVFGPTSSTWLEIFLPSWEPLPPLGPTEGYTTLQDLVDRKFNMNHGNPVPLGQKQLEPLRPMESAARSNCGADYV